MVTHKNPLVSMRKTPLSSGMSQAVKLVFSSGSETAPINAATTSSICAQPCFGFGCTKSFVIIPVSVNLVEMSSWIQQQQFFADALTKYGHIVTHLTSMLLHVSISPFIMPRMPLSKTCHKHELRMVRLAHSRFRGTILNSKVCTVEGRH